MTWPMTPSTARATIVSCVMGQTYAPRALRSARRGGETGQTRPT